jgi:hypothetical protein
MSSNDSNNAGTVLAEFIRQVREGYENSIAISGGVARDADGTPTGEVRVVALQNRKLQPEPPEAPQRAESPRRAHVFHDAAGLAAYLEKYRTESTVVLADVPERAIRVVLDERAADGFEMLHLEPQIHPLFKPWQNLMDRSADGDDIGLKELAEFILLNRRSITAPDGKALAVMFSQVRASTTVTLQQGRGRKAVNGIMMTTEIQGQTSTEPADLPDTITINVPLFVGGFVESLEVDILVSAADGGSRLVATVSSPQVEEAMVRAFEVMVADLKALPGVTVALGSPAHRGWEYLTGR